MNKIKILIALILSAWSCTSSQSNKPNLENKYRPIEFFSNEIDYYQEQYINEVLESDSINIIRIDK